MTEIEAVITELNVVRPLGSFAEADKAMREYQTLCKNLLDKSDYQSINNKRFVKRSGWRKLAVSYGVSFEIRDRTFTHDDNGRLLHAEFVVRAKVPNGRFADGWGACAAEERKQNKKMQHDIPATAETRAKNRACADLFGMGEVSAEEIDADAMRELPSDREKKQVQEMLDRLSAEQKAKVINWWQKTAKLPSFEQLDKDQLKEVEEHLWGVKPEDGNESEDSF